MKTDRVVQSIQFSTHAATRTPATPSLVAAQITETIIVRPHAPCTIEPDLLPPRRDSGEATTTDLAAIQVFLPFLLFMIRQWPTSMDLAGIRGRYQMVVLETADAQKPVLVG